MKQARIWLIICIFLVGCTSFGQGTVTSAAPVSVRIVPNTPAPVVTQTPTLTPAPIQPSHIGTPIALQNEAISSQNAAQLIEVARWGLGLPQQIAWSPDGKLIGVGTTRGLYFYSASSLGLLTSIEKGTAYRSLAFSPDGSMIAAGCESGKIEVWRLQDSKLLQIINGHEAAVMSLVFSPSGDMLASGGWDDSVLLWRSNDLSAGGEGTTPFQETPRWLFSSEGHGVRKIAFTADGVGLLVWSRFTQVQVYDLVEGTGQALPIGATKKDTNATIEISPTGEFNAEWKDSQILVYTTKNAYILYSLQIPSTIHNLVFSPDGAFMAVSGENTIHLFRMDGGRQIQAIQLTQGQADAGLLAIAPDNSKLVALGDALRVWDFAAVKLLEEVPISAGLKKASVSLQAGAVAAWNPQGTQVRLWRLQSVQDGTMLAETGLLKEHLIPVEDVAFSPDGQLIATAADGVRIWDSAQQKLLLELDAISEGAEQTFRVYNYDTGETRYIPLRGKSALSSLAFSPDGSILAAGGYDHRLYMWRMPEGIPLAVLQWDELGQPEEITYIEKVAFSPDGQRLAAADNQGGLSVWQIPPTPHISESAILAFDQAVRQLVRIQMDQVSPQNGEENKLCHLSIGAAGQEILAAWLDRSVRYAIKDGVLIEDSPSLCGLPAIQSQIGEQLLRLPNSGLSLSDGGDYPLLENSAYYPDSKLLLMVRSGSRGVVVQVWQVDAASLPDAVITHPYPFSSHHVALEDLLLTDQQLITAWLDGTIERWRLTDGGMLQSAALSSDQVVSSLALSPQGDYAVVATQDGQLNLWQISADGEPTQPKIVRSFAPLESENNATGKKQLTVVISLDFSTDRSVLASGTNDRKIYLWRVSDGMLIATLEHPSLPLELSFSATNSHLAVKSPDGIWVWRITEFSPDGAELFPYILPGYGMAFSPDGNILAVASRSLGNRKIDLWNVSEFVSSGHGSPIITIPAFGSFAFSPSGEEVVVSGIDLSLWNVREGRQLFTAPNSTPYGWIAITPNGRVMVAAGWEGFFHLLAVP